jgi:hypothetical protein
MYQIINNLIARTEESTYVLQSSTGEGFLKGFRNIFKTAPVGPNYFKVEFEFTEDESKARRYNSDQVDSVMDIIGSTEWAHCELPRLTMINLNDTIELEQDADLVA